MAILYGHCMDSALTTSSTSHGHCQTTMSGVRICNLDSYCLYIRKQGRNNVKWTLSGRCWDIVLTRFTLFGHCRDIDVTRVYLVWTSFSSCRDNVEGCHGKGLTRVWQGSIFFCLEMKIQWFCNIQEEFKGAVCNFDLFDNYSPVKGQNILFMMH